LVAELRKVAAPLNVEWVEGRCLSYGESMAYLPWVDMLRGLLGVSVEDAPLTVRDELRRWVEGLCPDHVGEVYPFLGRMMSLPLGDDAAARLRGIEPEGLKVLTFRALERVVEVAAGRRPLVLVCEDLHWADPTSLELLEQLLQLTDRTSLLLICALRPYREHPCWGIRDTATHLYHHRHTDVWLRPLSAADSEALVGALLHVEALPRPLRVRILDHAEGNPFYVEEVIRSLIDNGAIVYDEMMEQWEATRRVEDIAIPDTLQGVLMARIDRLEEEPRRVLQMASVIGRIFLYRVLSAITREEMELDQRLLTLQREEMIRERARVPELEYIFKHHLTQEAAYNGLLRRERRSFHRQVAEALERLFPDRVEEQLGLLARHWEQAGERERAVEYLQRAGEQAAAQFANAEAVGYFTRALDLTPEENLTARYVLLLARERVHDVQGAREAQRQDLAALEAIADGLDDDQRRAEVALRQARCAHHLPDYPGEIAAVRRAVRLARAVDDVRTEAAAYVWWGIALRYQGDHNAAQPRLERGLTLARAAHLRTEEAISLWNLAGVSRAQGDYGRARARYEQARRICREIGDKYLQNHLRLRLGTLATAQGDYDEARAHCEQAVAALREIGNQWEEGVAHHDIGYVYHSLGDYSEAGTHYQQYLENCREVGDRRGEAMALSQLGLLFHHVGENEIAQEYAEHALQMFRDQGDRGREGTTLTRLGHALMGLASLDEANDTYRQAVALLRELGRSRDAVEALAGLARVSQAQGDLDGAQAHVEEIVSYLETGTLDGTDEPFRVYLTCYRVLRANGDPRAEEILEEAHHLLQERAAKISDEGERRSYLENVAANREIASEYALVQGVC